VCLDVYVGGRLIAQTLANRYRADLERAGLGTGRHGFELALSAGLAFAPETVEVRRSSDGELLILSAEAATALERLVRSRAASHRR
jgi:O-antigen biosynthesis protein